MIPLLPFFDIDNEYYSEEEAYVLIPIDNDELIFSTFWIQVHSTDNSKKSMAIYRFIAWNAFCNCISSFLQIHSFLSLMMSYRLGTPDDDFNNDYNRFKLNFWQQRSVSHVSFRLDKMTRIAWELLRVEMTKQMVNFSKFIFTLQLFQSFLIRFAIKIFYNSMPLFNGTNISAYRAKRHHKMFAFIQST